MKLLNDKKLLEAAGQKAVYQSVNALKISEPRIENIANTLTGLLQAVRLESGGRPVEVSGFRLKNPADWLSQATSVSAELSHVSSACNMRCPFCYEEGDPEGASVLDDYDGMATEAEIETRLKLRRSSGKGLLRPLTKINEIFCNPDALSMIERMRIEAPSETLTFVTNGTYLTEDVIKRLADLRPIFFNFSVNSLDPFIRERILRDRSPDTAIRAIDLLQKYEIPYLGSLVCWPTIPWTDIRNTVLKLNEAHCAIIRYSLSAYSKHLKGRKFDRISFWDKGISVAKELMEEINVPLKIEPYHYYDTSIEANIVGTIPGSPAHAAGIGPHHRINSIEGIKILSANQALSMIAKTAGFSDTVKLDLVDVRTEEHITVILNEKDSRIAYPYKQLQRLPGFHWGIVLTENLKFSYLKAMKAQIAEVRARRVLVCSSEIMRPIVEDMIKKSGQFDDIDLHIEVPHNDYFGGTIVLGDLLVVDDYVRFIEEWCGDNGKPDLVLIPSSPFSLGEWGRDLAGQPFGAIARRTGLKVEQIQIKPLAG
ncbi:MAG: radical SAM protein [Planctomycetota bacterium]